MLKKPAGFADQGDDRQDGKQASRRRRKAAGRRAELEPATINGAKRLALIARALHPQISPISQI
ncbi:MAG TPA: hypothetical protein VGX78_19960 [Pirellulales bacterium]|nr:hypothetical protein [Pirellulales bacterium]